MLFLFTLTTGITLMITGKTWFSVWLGLEINMMSFLPIIMLTSPRGSEGGLKYFLVQAVASLIILQTSFSWFFFTVPAFLLMAPLALKLGMAPLHFWLPEVVKALGWSENMILLTLQKVGPLYLLSASSMMNSLTLIVLGLFSAVVGAAGGLNETDMRKLMAFSSIGHMGWMAVGMAMATTSWALYLIVYMVMALSVMMLLKKMKISYLSQLSSKGRDSVFMMAMLLSMGGFPPLLGFAPKWAILMDSLEVSLLVAIMLISTSVITLYYYIRAGLAVLTFMGPNQSFPTHRSTPLFLMLALLNTLGGGVYMFMWSSLVL
uniref:NADH-ubiquinone oxidoreductase chain 2 n=1 Tax=Proasellus coxalis TaxID=63229 RepID=A0A485M9D4_9CRUS|nr:NADH dehydrogenase subunit 2 [Proasellus coxalis]